MQLTVNPIAGYVAAEVDAAAATKYYGFTGAGGRWYIMRETTAAGVQSYRFASGLSDYATNWAGRAALDYGLFHASV